MIRAWLIRQLGGVPAPQASARVPLVESDPAGVQAFTDQARWVYALHDKRSDVFGQRAATILAFDGVLLSLLVAGLVAVKNNVEFTGWVVANVVALAVLPVLSAFACLRALYPRKVLIQEAGQLHNQWSRFLRSEPGLHMPALVVNALLGDAEGPLASIADEARGRGWAFERALELLVAAVLALGVLAVQLIVQQT